MRICTLAPSTPVHLHLRAAARHPEPHTRRDGPGDGTTGERMYAVTMENRGDTRYHATSRGYEFVLGPEGAGASPGDTVPRGGRR